MASTPSFNNILSNTTASTPSPNNILSNTMADAIDLDFSGSESEFEPEGSAESTNNDSDTDNNSNDSESGALSPASAARVEELTRELYAIRKGNGKERARPSGLHLFTDSGLHCFHPLISVRPSSAENHIMPDLLSLLALRHRAIGDPPSPNPPSPRLGTAKRASLRRVAQDNRDKRQRKAIWEECGAASHLEKLAINCKIRDAAVEYGYPLRKPWARLVTWCVLP